MGHIPCNPALGRVDFLVYGLGLSVGLREELPDKIRDDQLNVNFGSTMNRF